jgi:hypothetical protein
VRVCLRLGTRSFAAHVRPVSLFCQLTGSISAAQPASKRGAVTGILKTVNHAMTAKPLKDMTPDQKVGVFPGAARAAVPQPPRPLPVPPRLHACTCMLGTNWVAVFALVVPPPPQQQIYRTLRSHNKNYLPRGHRALRAPQVAMVANVRNGLALLTAVEFSPAEAELTASEGGVDALVEILKSPSSDAASVGVAAHVLNCMLSSAPVAVSAALVSGGYVTAVVAALKKHGSVTVDVAESCVEIMRTVAATAPEGTVGSEGVRVVRAVLASMEGKSDRVSAAASQMLTTLEVRRSTLCAECVLENT